jgi:two-component system, sporulation sensor kinase A
LVLTINSTDIIDFQQVVNNSTNAIIIVNENEEIIYCNTYGLKLFNLPIDEILYKKIYQFVPSSQHCMASKRLKRVIENGETLEPKDAKIKQSNGELVDIEFSSVPYYFDGKVFAQIAIRDVSHRKLSEELSSNNERLASIGQLAAGIVHEIKNPLTAVKGFLQLLKESFSHSYLDTMESELNKALETLQNVLQISRPALKEEPFIHIDVHKELTSILTLFQEKLYSLEIEMDVSEPEITIVGKRNSLIKAFFNLIKNAVEAIEGDGKIKIALYNQDGWVHINLSDTGMGIHRDNLKMLGTPFFSSKINGTGLGLTQVYNTINEHHGVISVESVSGKGTTFYIKLPVHLNE